MRALALIADRKLELTDVAPPRAPDADEVLGPGDPDVGNGWSPESYFYYDLSDGRSLQALTVHGLLVELTAIRTRPVTAKVNAVPEPVRRRRWWEFWKPAA